MASQLKTQDLHTYEHVSNGGVNTICAYCIKIGYIRWLSYLYELLIGRVMDDMAVLQQTSW